MEIHPRKRRVGRLKGNALKYPKGTQLPPWITKADYNSGIASKLKQLLDENTEVQQLRKQMAETLNTGQIAKIQAKILPLWIANREDEIEQSVIKFISEVPGYLATEVNNLSVRHRAKRSLTTDKVRKLCIPENEPKNASSQVLEAYKNVVSSLRVKAESLVLKEAAEKWREKYAPEET